MVTVVALIAVLSVGIARGAAPVPSEPATPARRNLAEGALRQALGDPVGGKTACTISGGASSRCLGIPPAGLNFEAPNDGVALAAWIASDLANSKNVWRAPSPAVLRKAKGGGQRPQMSVAVLKDADQVPMNKLTSTTIIVARIELNTAGAKDYRYGISDPRNEMTKYFYVVFEGWHPTDAGSPDDTTVGTWAVYGIKKGTGGAAAKLINAGNTGPYRLCKMTHDPSTRADGARFMTCDQARAISMSNPDMQAVFGMPRTSVLRDVDAKLAGKRDAGSVSAAVSAVVASVSRTGTRTAPTKDQIDRVVKILMRIYADDEYSPAWMMCGGGCCTADQ